MTISDDSLIARCGGLIEAEVDGELVGLHVDNGTCYGFNKTATRIWALLDEPRTLAELCERLVAEFDIDAEACRRDVEPLLRELEAEKLIQLSSR